MTTKRAKHILFKAYPASWMIEGVLKTQAQITALHYGRGQETVKISVEEVRKRLMPAYVKIAQALSIHFNDTILPEKLFGLSLNHDLVTGQLIVTVDHRVDGDEQKYNIEFTQAAGHWTLPERCAMDSEAEDRAAEVFRISQML